MKIRAITLGLSFSSEDLQGGESHLRSKLLWVKNCLSSTKTALEEFGYVVQTIRLALNSFEHWLLPLVKSPEDEEFVRLVTLIERLLTELSIDFCSFGPSQQMENFHYIPHILALAPHVSCSTLFTRPTPDVDQTGHSSSAMMCASSSPEFEACRTAAQVCLDLAQRCGDLGNFRYCSAFQCPPDTPFFPVAYHGQEDSTAKLSIGLENGDLLFLSFFGAKTKEEAKKNLQSTLTQVLKPIQEIVRKHCEEVLNQNREEVSLATPRVIYAGIDASINPGLTVIDSVAQGLEHLLPEQDKAFGAPGTLAAVSTITAAVKAIGQENDILLAGYSGLMLPVMEDLTLATRANENRFTLRDLLLFSSVCGVGIDTVPVPGDSSVDAIAGLYMDVGAMAFRLNKPLTCRILPLAGLKAGDQTRVESPYLCNTKVFSIN